MRLPRLTVSAALLAIALGGCTPQSPGQSTELTLSDQAAIRTLDSTFVQAWLHDDTTAVLSVFRPDAVLLPPGSQPISGLTAIRAYWWPLDGSHTRITAFDRQIAEIAGTKGLAYLRGTGALTWEYTKGGPPHVQSSRSTDLILVARDSAGQWRVVRQMWSTLP